ncbi:hypothetical protein GS429_08370 [Natronorubrum sp. JWXQ-INN-674]|uniref:Uncharacterized protein n=1 Tax=Natronorubrum halalkaliphilum TaxID=2691917 RepID=A0A6B0VKJ3_9EURY|nr:hypothetical protein [Natronorubrum halalkaliphilum]MXV62074.1 hypothetical protein [Natronorubrum halalkaliphilum]
MSDNIDWDRFDYRVLMTALRFGDDPHGGGGQNVTAEDVQKAHERGELPVEVYV